MTNPCILDGLEYLRQEVKNLRKDIEINHHYFIDRLQDFIVSNDARLVIIESMLSDQQKEIDDLNLAIINIIDEKKIEKYRLFINPHV